MVICDLSWKKIKQLSVVGALVSVLALPCADAQETLNLVVSVVTGETGVDFGQLRSLGPGGEPSSDSSVRQVRLTVTSDLRKSYIISQVVAEAPANPNGAMLQPDAIRVTVAVEEGSGTLKSSHLEPLSPNAQEIYISADTEERTVLLITYDFLVPPGQPAGRYQGMITYRVDAR